MNGEQLNEPNLEKAFRPIASLHSELNRNFIGNCMARDCGKLGINLSNFPSALSKAQEGGERERHIMVGPVVLGHYSLGGRLGPRVLCLGRAEWRGERIRNSCFG